MDDRLIHGVLGGSRLSGVAAAAALVVAVLLAAAVAAAGSSAAGDGESRSWRYRSAVYRSKAFVLKRGSVSNKFEQLEMPKGHIGLKSFDAEVVDEAGQSVPLHETYLHHWVVVRYFSRAGEEEAPDLARSDPNPSPRRLPARNAGVCPNDLTQFFGLGSETRRTRTWVPDPYAIEVGNPREIPEGYEEKWMLNVHAIDTRGVEDRLGCTECRCALYNATGPKPGYVGGYYCCEDEAQCRLRTQRCHDDDDDVVVGRSLYLKYRVRWVDWEVESTSMPIPVKIYIFDVTYTHGIPNPHCKVEYTVDACDGEGSSECVHVKRSKAAVPEGGDIVYGVAHQHTGGIGSTLYGQDGRVLCTSTPEYGTGEEAGNEAGYIVGMSTCYPAPNTATIADGELLTAESNYNSSRLHTGVMGLFYILVAQPRTNILL